MGGTSENVRANFGFELNGNRYEIESLRKILRANPFNSTTRQYARAIADDIHTGLVKHKITPPIASKVGLKDADAFWGFDAADRSTSCPDTIKQKLLDHLDKVLKGRNR
jgi:hypothetical protein